MGRASEDRRGAEEIKSDHPGEVTFSSEMKENAVTISDGKAAQTVEIPSAKALG